MEGWWGYHGQRSEEDIHDKTSNKEINVGLYVEFQVN